MTIRDVEMIVLNPRMKPDKYQNRKLFCILVL